MCELRKYLLPCPLHEGRYARDCCEATTDDSLPKIPFNVLVDFFGCRNCPLCTAKSRTFTIKLQNIEPQLLQFSQYFKQKYDLDITFKGIDFKHIQYTIKNTIFIDNSQDYWRQRIKNDLKMLIKQKQNNQIQNIIQKMKKTSFSKERYGINARYVVDSQHIDQNGIINVQPKFVSWSLVPQQNLVDKNCRLQPYTCSGCNMNCFIDPSKEWNQQKAVQEISQQIAKEVDQELSERLLNMTIQQIFEYLYGSMVVFNNQE